MAKIQITNEDLLYMVNESINRIGFEYFRGRFNKYFRQAISEAENSLSKFRLSIVVQPDYNFGNKNWLAVYITSMNDIRNNIIRIAVNYPLIYKEMKKRGIDEDEYNIEAQARITTMHEVGHGLIDWLSIKYPNILEKEFPDIDNEDVEEDVAEEYGLSFFSDATGVYSSKLGDVLAAL